jgi:DNA polymerase-3 subunit delta'
MLFSDVVGQEDLKKELKKGVLNGRVPHCQLFISREGTGGLSLAIAYARQIIEGQNPSESTRLKLSELKHPDLHFVFPTATNKEIKSKPTSEMFLNPWREFVHKTPYGNLFDWYQSLDIENKQGKIGNDDVESLINKISLKSFEGGWKVAIIWMVEKMNLTATNKLLKLIEEPPINTVFLFVCESKNSLADTLVSRCQTSTLSPLKKEAVELYLKNKGVEGLKAKNSAINSSGNLRQALISVYNNDQNQQFELWFLKWVRTAFNVKKNKEEVLGLVNWSKNISTKGREVQKKFLEFSMNLFRNAMLKHYEIEQLVSFSPTTDINFEGFSKYVNERNIEEIHKELESAFVGIESNGNPNMIFMDLSLKLTRLIQ